MTPWGCQREQPEGPAPGWTSSALCSSVLGGVCVCMHMCVYIFVHVCACLWWGKEKNGQRMGGNAQLLFSVEGSLRE